MLEESDVNWIETRVHYLRMDKKPRVPVPMDPRLQMQRIHPPVDPSYYLELYQGVGLGYDWVDRFVMPQSQVEELINAANVAIFVFLFEDQPCGFVEFVIGVDSVELLYFGLFPEFTGRGLGGRFLRMAVDRAWGYEPQWIELNTCELDNERAMHVYRNAGFEVYCTRTERRRSFFRHHRPLSN
jgi:GNAT superfamily N-acetyltransferase